MPAATRGRGLALLKAGRLSAHCLGFALLGDPASSRWSWLDDRGESRSMGARASSRRCPPGGAPGV